MTTSAQPDYPGVIEMSRAEWDAAVDRDLARLHLTRDDIRDMAKRWDFSSLDARMLWMVIDALDQE
jgi:hypothetical protein